MTDTAESTVSSAQLDRIAQLRAKRGQLTPPPNPPGERVTAVANVAAGPTPTATRRRRRRHAAQGSRILAAGLGAATMFGIVGILGLDHPFTSPGEPATTPAGLTAPVPAAPPVRVVVDRRPAPAVASGSTIADTTAPIVLTANPVVQTVTVAAPATASAPAPAARTNGSR